MNFNPPSRDLETFDIEVRLLLEGIFLKYKFDFRQYCISSVRRRLTIAIEKLNCSSVSALQEVVLSDARAFQQLLGIMTIPTTEMFRDPDYFRVIREEVIPILRTYPSFKIWIAGCSTGEELYSMAILLAEEDLLDRVLLYATDISPQSLKNAESGIFPISQLPLYTANYQKAGGKRAFSDYYQAAYDSALFSKHLRSNVLFADHSLATDSVFAEVEFISCRNVLIYFDRKLQDRAFRLFYDSLGNRGFLGLGSKETLQFSGVAHGFEIVSEREKLYRRKGAA